MKISTRFVGGSGTAYADAKGIVDAFGGVGPVFWYGDPNVFVMYVVVDKGLSVIQWQNQNTASGQPDPKPASFDTDFPHAIRIPVELSVDTDINTVTA